MKQKRKVIYTAIQIRIQMGLWVLTRVSFLDNKQEPGESTY